MTMEQPKVISQNLKILRERNKLTQDNIAKYLGVKREQISYYENGERRIPVEYLNKLANLFEVKLTDFLEEDPRIINSNAMLAFRANELIAEDLTQIADFRKIVKNYLKILKILESHEG
jgi:transcriptional regulator with XRE-family HTH domain